MKAKLLNFIHVTIETNVYETNSAPQNPRRFAAHEGRSPKSTSIRASAMADDFGSLFVSYFIGDAQARHRWAPCLRQGIYYEKIRNQ